MNAGYFRTPLGLRIEYRHKPHIAFRIWANFWLGWDWYDERNPVAP